MTMCAMWHRKVWVYIHEWLPGGLVAVRIDAPEPQIVVTVAENLSNWHYCAVPNLGAYGFTAN